MRISSAGTSELVPSSAGTGARIAALVVALLVVVADRITKLLIRHSVQSFDAIPILPGWLRIVHAENPGAAFGVLAEGNPFIRNIVLIGISGAVLVFVFSALWNRGGAFRSLATRYGLALILGGALGNLSDRILRGTVTDFIEVYHRAWTFPAFNVADSAITVGAFLLLLDLIKPGGPSIQERARRN